MDDFISLHRRASENLLIVQRMAEQGSDDKDTMGQFLIMAREFATKALDVATLQIQRHLEVDIIAAIEHMKIEVMDDKYVRDITRVSKRS